MERDRPKRDTEVLGVAKRESDKTEDVRKKPEAKREEIKQMGKVLLHHGSGDFSCFANSCCNWRGFVIRGWLKAHYLARVFI